MIGKIAGIEKQRLTVDERGFRGSESSMIWVSLMRFCANSPDFFEAEVLRLSFGKPQARSGFRLRSLPFAKLRVTPA